MPVFEYVCRNCGVSQDEWLDAHSSASVSCLCGQEMVRAVSDLRVNFKGWDWPTKNENENVFRTKENSIMQRRVKERPVDRVLPNVNGERVDSWSEAQKLAQDKGLVSSSYEPLVREEKRNGSAGTL